MICSMKPVGSRRHRSKAEVSRASPIVLPLAQYLAEAGDVPRPRCKPTLPRMRTKAARRPR